MAKRIKIKGKAPRGLSKKERIVEGADARFKGEKRYVKRNPFSEPWMAESYLETAAGQRDYAAFSKDAKRGATRPSSTRKKLVKEGNRKFIGPRQFSSELAEDRGRGNLNTPSSYRSYHRQLDREILERDDPTVDVHRSNAGRGGQLRGGLSPKVVAKLKAAAKKIATKPASQMTDRERKFIRNIDAMGHYLGNYRD